MVFFWLSFWALCRGVPQRWRAFLCFEAMHLCWGLQLFFRWRCCAGVMSLDLEPACQQLRMGGWGSAAMWMEGKGMRKRSSPAVKPAANQHHWPPTAHSPHARCLFLFPGMPKPSFADLKCLRGEAASKIQSLFLGSVGADQLPSRKQLELMLTNASVSIAVFCRAWHL